MGCWSLLADAGADLGVVSLAMLVYYGDAMIGQCEWSQLPQRQGSKALLTTAYNWSQVICTVWKNHLLLLFATFPALHSICESIMN
jgi:hypothetical protein